MMKEETHIFQGLRRDNHQIRQDSKFLWDAHNIRLTNREGNSFLSITNEKGTSAPLLEFENNYTGHCVLGKYLVVFTASVDADSSNIYRVEKTKKGEYKSVVLYHNDGDTVLDAYCPIEAIGVYETEDIQKVYWVDGKHQPRVINIAKEIANYDINSFDFVPSLSLNEHINVIKVNGEGTFSSGIIQYAFTYYNKYGQESNIFYTTPLNYISPDNRGGSPEEKVANSFKLEIKSPDINFEYIRIYSIHRTSIDVIPTVKRVIDLPINKYKINNSITYIDKGTTGDIVDPKLLLYIGGKEIVPKCMAVKDRTLFFGNINIKEDDVWLDIKERVLNDIKPDSWSPITYKVVDTTDNKNSEYYSYKSSINSPGFKCGETYRLGIQFQSKTGVWSEPIFLKDDILSSTYPYMNNSSFVWSSQSVKLGAEVCDYLTTFDYKRARACVVLPTMSDRTILCQGILCPTVYNIGARNLNAPYAMSSWFFRPQTKSLSNSFNVYKGANVEFNHNRPLFTGTNRGAEVQCTPSLGIKTIADITSLDKHSSYFFVDANLVTFHSPEIEFDTIFQNSLIEDSLELKVLGDVTIGSIIGDIDIQTSTPAKHSDSSGFNHTIIGYNTKNGEEVDINGGLIGGLFYQDSLIKKGKEDQDNTYQGDPIYHFIYPWHRSGSVNNDSRTNKGTRSAVLSKKKISNLKFFNTFNKAEESITYDIDTPQIFNSNEVSLLKVWVDYLNKTVPYYGNVDLLVTPPKQGYNLYIGDSFASDLKPIPIGNDIITNSSDAVRIKYKSSPHLVFSLKGDNPKKIEVLPTKIGMGASINGELYTIPTWDSTSGPEEDDNPDVSSALELSKISDGDLDIGDTGTFIGKYSYKPTEKAFLKAIESSIGHYEWSYSEAKKSLSEGSLFVVIGDGKSCLLLNQNIIPDGVSGPHYYKGPTRYFKLKNAQYPTGENKILGDLVEASLPPKTLKGKESNVQDKDNEFRISQKNLNKNDQSNLSPFIILAELRRKKVSNRFGGNSENAKESNLWIPAGEPVTIGNNTVIKFTYGDTWYSRYDCLKTYPFTQEDENSIIEIGSFMCETHINIDGRYDKNRGQISNLNMSPQNFNLFNEVYSQTDNFFNYRVLDKDYYKQSLFSNQITWTKEKHAGEEVDSWTNITLANTLDMDGERGAITALKSWNDHLLCFQEKALSQILFNSRVQVPTSDGVPIEISNGYKVDGNRLISSNIGCSNKWSILDTGAGVYFFDSNTEDIYLFNGQLSNLSQSKGMSWWCRENHENGVYGKGWHPMESNNIRTFYDERYGDIYFTPSLANFIADDPVLPQHDALCYSEQLGQFTSLMSYGGIQAMFNFADGFYSLKSSNKGLNTQLYENFVGDYNNLYGNQVDWSFSFISNDTPIATKIFDTIEMRADIFDNEGTLLNECPISSIGIENEYQKGLASNSLSRKVHQPLNMKKKFRVWRGLIPRHNLSRQRIRNPWAQITIGGGGKLDNNKVIIHDVSVKYTI